CGFVWRYDFAVVLENHPGRITGFKARLGYVLSFGNTVGNEAVPKRVVFPFDARAFRESGNCLFWPLVVTTKSAVSRTTKQPLFEIVGNRNKPLLRGVAL